MGKCKCICKTGEIFSHLPKMSITGTTLKIDYDAYSTDSSFYEEMEISYCPFCGSNLEKIVEVKDTQLQIDFDKVHKTIDEQHAYIERVRGYLCSEQMISQYIINSLNNNDNLFRKAIKVSQGMPTAINKKNKLEKLRNRLGLSKEEFIGYLDKSKRCELLKLLEKRTNGVSDKIEYVTNSSNPPTMISTGLSVSYGTSWRTLFDDGLDEGDDGEIGISF